MTGGQIKSRGGASGASPEFWKARQNNLAALEYLLLRVATMKVARGFGLRPVYCWGMKKHPENSHHPKKRAKRPAEFEGTITITTKGSGYVRTSPTAKNGDDIEIPPERLNTALNRDLVRVELSDRPGFRGRRYGTVTEVIERSQRRFIGIVDNRDGVWLLYPDDRKVYTAMHLGNADDFALVPKLKVAADFIRWDNPNKLPKATIVEVLGPAGAHETEMRAAVAAQGFDWNFPNQVMEEAHAIEASKLQILNDALKTRRDFRSVTTFTIDPADAKDFDDAISVQTLPDGQYEIGVHIADVSAYVQKEDAIDKEAQKRGTSIYLVDRTIPMLPEVLSNDVCSLNPNEEKLTFSAVFTIDPTTLVPTDIWFGETVIRSAKRFAYEEAQEILDTKEGTLYDELALADRVAVAFRKQRFKEGSIAFETDEVKFTLDASGFPVDVYKKQRQETNLMIEDLMLMANKAVAEHINDARKKKNADYVFVWRIHDIPDPERIMDLAIFLKALGYDFEPKDGLVSHKDINALFKAIENKPEKGMIETATIRSMAKAIYSTKNIGHFGLAFPFYTHFTSPIRRYPDLMVHRILKSHLEKKPVTAREHSYYERLCARSSEREVAAVEAERASIKLKQVEYMSTKVGQTFNGIITGISDWGIFAEEEKSKAEGMARLRNMSGDIFKRGAGGFRLIGEQTGTTYTIGQKIEMRLASVNIEDKTIDWEILS